MPAVFSTYHFISGSYEFGLIGINRRPGTAAINPICKRLHLYPQEFRISWRRIRHHACKPRPQPAVLYIQAASKPKCKLHHFYNPYLPCIEYRQKKLAQTRTAIQSLPLITKTS
jgi:hypothetical protein